MSEPGHSQDTKDKGPVEFALGVIGLTPSAVVEPSEELLILGAGNSKTGTKSLQSALEFLGHKIYDTTVIMSEGHVDYLYNATMAPDGKPWGLYPESKGNADREAAIDVWHQKMLEFGATATLDMPLCYFVEELLARSPNAKVILTTHPSSDPVVWSESLATTWAAFEVIRGWPFILSSDFNSWIPGVLELPTVGCKSIDKWWNPPWLPWINSVHLDGFHDKQLCIERYEWWNQRTREVTPPGKFLDFQVTQGWEPLCTFLEIPAAECPSAQGIPFPHANERAANEVIGRVLRVIAFGYPFLALIPLLFLYALYRACKCCCCRKAPAASQEPSEAQQSEKPHQE